MDIRGAVALVTGGASGLGFATARRLVDDGASVVLVDLPQSAGAEAAAELDPHGERVRFVPADVADPAQVQAADLGPDALAQERKLSAIVRIDAELGIVEVLPVSGDFDRSAPLRSNIALWKRAYGHMYLQTCSRMKPALP